MLLTSLTAWCFKLLPVKTHRDLAYKASASLIYKGLLRIKKTETNTPTEREKGREETDLRSKKDKWPTNE